MEKGRRSSCGCGLQYLWPSSTVLKENKSIFFLWPPPLVIVDVFCCKLVIKEGRRPFHSYRVQYLWPSSSVLKENKLIILLLVATSTTPSGSFTFTKILADGKSPCVVVPGCCYVCLLMAQSTDLSSRLLWTHVALFKNIRSASSKKNVGAKRIIHNTCWQAYVELSTKATHPQYFTQYPRSVGSRSFRYQTMTE